VTTGAGPFFDAMAASYDDLEPWYEHLYAVLHALVRAELAPQAAASRLRAVDAGCGTGFQTAILQELGYETLGVDLSAGLLRVARQRCAGARLVQGDVEALPWRSETVDLVVSCGSTLSFVPHPDRGLAEIERILRPGGRAFLEVEHRWSLDLAWRLASSVAGDILGYGVGIREACRGFAPPLGEGIWIDYPGYPTLRLFTMRELRQLLGDAGLVPVRMWGLHSVTNVMPSTWLHRASPPRTLTALYRGLRSLDQALAATRLARGLSNSLVILATKPSRRPATTPRSAGRPPRPTPGRVPTA
jgi:MPBQ/MSBQ methyltransferase